MADQVVADPRSVTRSASMPVSWSATSSSDDDQIVADLRCFTMSTSAPTSGPDLRPSKRLIDGDDAAEQSPDDAPDSSDDEEQLDSSDDDDEVFIFRSAHISAEEQWTAWAVAHEASTAASESLEETTSAQHAAYGGDIAMLYSHTQLPDANTQIRLLRFTSRQGEDIRLVITTHELVELPAYTAVSYTWGQETLNRMIWIDDKSWLVRANCWYALHQLAKHIQTRYIWIDAICIDQHNLDERSKQVQLMRQIFAGATTTVVSLGKHDDASKILFDRAQRIGTHTRRDDKPAEVMPEVMNTVSDPKGDGRLTQEEFDAMSKVVQYHKPLALMQSSTGVLIRSLGLFGRRSYWSRLWIVPEILVSKDVWLMCDEDNVPLDRIRSLVDLVLRWIQPSIGLFDQGPGMRHSICHWPLQSPMINILGPSLDNGGSGLSLPCFWHNWLNSDIFVLLEHFAEYKCADPRDRIFALLGLVKNQPRIQIGYDCGLMEFALHALDVLSTSKMQMHRPHPFSLAEGAESCALILRGLRLLDRTPWEVWRLYNLREPNNQSLSVDIDKARAYAHEHNLIEQDYVWATPCRDTAASGSQDHAPSNSNIIFHSSDGIMLGSPTLNLHQLFICHPILHQLFICHPILLPTHGLPMNTYRILVNLISNPEHKDMSSEEITEYVNCRMSSTASQPFTCSTDAVYAIMHRAILSHHYVPCQILERKGEVSPMHLYTTPLALDITFHKAADYVTMKLQALSRSALEGILSG